jgi:hypothetical protein
MQEGPRQDGISTRQDRNHEEAEALRARQAELRATKDGERYKVKGGRFHKSAHRGEMPDESRSPHTCHTLLFERRIPMSNNLDAVEKLGK